MEIGFNAKFLVEILSTQDCTQVRLEMSEPNRAGLLIPEDGDANEDTLMLIMPVMLNSYV
jgi:DNA polymerase-3 subunit beta